MLWQGGETLVTNGTEEPPPCDRLQRHEPQLPRAVWVWKHGEGTNYNLGGKSHQQLGEMVVQGWTFRAEHALLTVLSLIGH